MSEQIPGAPATLGAVRQLTEIITDARQREEEIEKQHRLVTARAKRECVEAVGGIEAERDNQIAAEQSGFHLAKEAAEAKRARREGWVAAAFTRAEQRLVQSVEGAKGREISQVQAQTLAAKRRGETELAEARSALARLGEQLRDDKSRYRKLRDEAGAALRGFPGLARKLSPKAGATERASDMPPPDVLALGEELGGKLADVAKELQDFNRQGLPKVFRYLPLQWLGPIVAAAIASAGYLGKWSAGQFVLTAAVAGGAFVFLLVVQRIAAKAAAPGAARLAERLDAAAETFTTCTHESEAWLDSQRRSVEENLEGTVSELNRGLTTVIKGADEVGAEGPSRIAQQERRVSARNLANFENATSAIDQAHESDRNRIQATASQRVQETQSERDRVTAAADAERDTAWTALENDWTQRTQALYASLDAGRSATAAAFPEWEAVWMDNWSAPQEFAHAAPFASLELSVPELSEGLPESERLPLPGPGQFTVPMCLSLPAAGSLLFESESSGDPQVICAMNNAILRLLSVAPPGKLSFSIIDPVGLGQNFAGVTHLSDYEDSIINGRIWTQREHIETRIRELGEHMEKVIQMYLRNEYETITEYNLKAGNIAEKYHFLVVADFPANFSDAAVRGLLSIAASGARCGIYTLLHWDRRQTVPEAFEADDMRKHSVVMTGGSTGGAFTFADGVPDGTSLLFASPPDDAAATRFIQRIGETSSDSNRIEVPFSQIMPAAAELWQSDTTDELRIAIGRTGATKLQQLSIGKGTRQHALFAGKTGSGKSTLFHVIITNLALACSPEQVEFYLVDFKKGVEFKCYGSRRLPHARVVAIESDREFGLSVLQRLDEELKRRGEKFRDLGVQDVAGFKKAGGGVLPRTLLIIDEFQEFFVEDDKIAQQASVLLDRIVRQGRAFGIHVLLGSQTLGGAYSLAKATLGQMVIRVALMCNEADAYLIMDESNAAPRLLTRPGEGIYNDSAGALQGNSPFQTVWLSEEERDRHLETVLELRESTGIAGSPPIVFEGNAPADVAENAPLAALLAGDSPPLASPKIWLGAPNAIKGPTEVSFHRQSGNHLLIVGQRDDAVLAMMGIALISLSAQCPGNGVQFYVLDGSAPGSAEREFLDGICSKLPHPVHSAHERDVGELIGELAAELKARSEGGAEGSPPIFVFVGGIQRHKKLRYDEDLAYSFDASATEGNPALQFDQLITEGSVNGIHLIAAVDSYNNIGRCLSRKALSEFELRVLFQMGANDSAALVDSTKASGLGMHRALLYNEHEGYLETFRPYAQPGPSWINSCLEAL